MKTRELSRISAFLALAITLGLIETLFIPTIIPGAKIGFANIVVVTILFSYSFKTAFFISIMRVILVGILTATFLSHLFFFSLAGALLSIIVMGITKKLKLSIIGCSVSGAIAHSMGQIFIGNLLLKTNALYSFLPILMITSIVSGIIIGFISKELVNRLEDALSYE